MRKSIKGAPSPPSSGVSAKPKEGTELETESEIDEKSDSKASNADRRMVNVAVLHAAMGRAGGRRGAFGKILKANICTSTALASAANTAFTTPYALVPSGGTEWSSFAALYDEARCVGITFKWIAFCNSQITVGVPFGGLSFGPAAATTNASVAQCMESTQHLVFPFVQCVGITGTAQGTNPAKFQEWHIRLSRDVLTSSSSSNYVGGQWYPTTDTSTQVGVVCPYFEAAGGTVVTNWKALVLWHMEFRSRG